MRQGFEVFKVRIILKNKSRFETVGRAIFVKLRYVTSRNGS